MELLLYFFGSCLSDFIQCTCTLFIINHTLISSLWRSLNKTQLEWNSHQTNEWRTRMCSGRQAFQRARKKILYHHNNLGNIPLKRSLSFSMQTLYRRSSLVCRNECSLCGLKQSDKWQLLVLVVLRASGAIEDREWIVYWWRRTADCVTQTQLFCNLTLLCLLVTLCLSGERQSLKALVSHQKRY